MVKKTLAVIGLLAIVGTIIAVAAIMFWPSGGNAAEKALAQSSLRNVISAAEIYREEHDNVYEGLTAAKIQNTVSEKVVDGMPKAGQVGIMDYNSDQLVLLFVGQSGSEYKVTVKSGSIEWDF
ncbi:MAG: hypothetical protein WC891_04180 [Actinomycetota bacterium]